MIMSVYTIYMKRINRVNLLTKQNKTKQISQTLGFENCLFKYGLSFKCKKRGLFAESIPRRHSRSREDLSLVK